MASFLPGFQNESMVTVGFLSNGLNVTTLLSIIQSLSPENRHILLNKLGMGSEDDLRQLVGGAMTPTRHVHTEMELMHYPEYRAHKLLRLYIPPILLLLGTFGNIFSFLILRHKAMARQSTHHFLAALAVTDSLVLYIGLFRQWVGDMTGFDPQTQSVWLCKSIVMLGYTCSNVSVWIIVAVTVERYIVVCHPLKANMVCNVTRAKRAVMGLAAVFILVNLHFLWTAGLTWQETSGGQRHSPVCNNEEGHEFLITAVWPWVDALLYGFGPFVIIFVLNIFIIVHVVRATSGRVVLQNRCFAKSPVLRKACSPGINGGINGGAQYVSPNVAIRSSSSGSVNSNNVSISSGGSSHSISGASGVRGGGGGGCSGADGGVGGVGGGGGCGAVGGGGGNGCGGIGSGGNVCGKGSDNNIDDKNNDISASSHTLTVPGSLAKEYAIIFNNNNNNNGVKINSHRIAGGSLGGSHGGIGGGSLSGGGDGGGGRVIGSNRCSNRRFTSNTNIRLTVMLLTVSFTFLLTTLPMNISVIASAFWNRQSQDVATMSKFQLVFTVAELLMYLNHSVNFFLYCATGHKFRCEIVRMVCGKQRSNAAISDHSRHIYCSRNCVASGFTEIRNTNETGL